MTLAGFPHSGISGSTLTCSSPKLFAAYRALLRLSVPRHPPCALLSLDRIFTLAVVSDEVSSGPPNSLQHTLGALESMLSLDFFLPNPLPVFSNQLQDFESALTDARPVRTFCSEELTRRSRKEVIQPQVPLRLPCYDFAPVTALAFGRLVPCGFRHGLRALTASMA